MRSGFLWKRRVPVAIVGVILAACSAAWILGHDSFTPSGIYYDKYIGSEGSPYWVFREGKVELRAPGADKDPGGIRVEDMGTYSRTDKRWVMRGGPADPEVMLKPGLFGIRTICPSKSYLNRYDPERQNGSMAAIEGDRFFADSSKVFLHGLLGSKRQGTCSSMPVLYSAVGRRLGYPLKLVTIKGHLFVRWEGAGERLNV